jgi:hypothetical protein
MATDERAEAGSQTRQQCVSRGVTERVVVVLEAVEIEEREDVPAPAV